MPKYRVRAFSLRRLMPHGYMGYETVRHQWLQVKRWWGWKTIDEEEVPADVVIALGATGFSEWKSKFLHLGTFGKDGAVIPHQIEP